MRGKEPSKKAEAMVGVGLRSPHYPHLLGRPRTPVKWFEAISENYLDSQGRPLEILLKMREDFPIALHGVSMSIGGVEGPRPGYLEKLRALVDRVDPLLVTDHLCFTGAHATNVHDLLPMPYTDEAIATVARNVARAQDVLGRQIALENVSSYLTYRDSTMTEWDFVVAVARRAGCKILLDVNNAYVSATNHAFAPETYVDAIPAELVAQIHLGGYSDMGNFLFDTHSRAPTDPVWELYRRVIGRMPKTPVLVEWDEDVPSWDGLEAQAVKAARIAAEEYERQPA
jgi:uncharacterized protein (UPF0276 family)